MAMKTIEQIRASAAAAAEKAEREYAIAQTQPAQVRERIEFVFSDRLSKTPRIHYKATDAADALTILRAYPAPLDVSKHLGGGCCSIAPEQFQGRYASDPLRWTVPQCVLLSQSGGRSYFTASLQFWTESEHVTIEFPLAYSLRDNKTARYGTNGDVISSQFHQGGLTGYAQRTQYWSPEDSFNTSYAYAGADAVSAAILTQQVAV